MRMAELSRTTAVPVPTIKYYLREGLVPPGFRAAANQALYGDTHVRRLRLIRALVEIGALPISTVRAVLAAVDSAGTTTHDVLGVVHHALAIRGADTDPTDLDDEGREVAAFIATLGWRVKPTAPAIRELGRALRTLRHLGWRVTAEVFTPYARAADDIAAWELDQLPRGPDRTAVVEGVVVGTVVFEAALLALRRLAEEHHSSARFGNDRRPSPGTR
jgi:DNA-binding transcriptional MerR regulator